MTTPIQPTRRRFLQVVGLGLAAPTVLQAAACGDDAGGPNIPLATVYFPQGVASGDPRPDSVVLWARVEDPDATGDLALTLLLGTDESFAHPLAEVDLVATADNDHVVKLKVSGLDPATHYFYRFVYEKAGGERLGSRTARTKTAPAADADVKVKIALASCQDFIGRYFNSYAKMLEFAADLDVVVHIGDYVYETTGDPSFQSEGTADRKVEFTDTAGAIAFKDADGNITNYAAQSLSNYRELYKAYRSDPWLQLVHESVPFVFIWDDHEFSDDCWQDSATYSDGQTDERHETDRRKNGERANFEYLPTEHGLGADGRGPAIGGKTPIADPGTVIYRDFRFGKHLHLVLTDTRTYRPDHGIPEDVHPGRVALTTAELVAAGLEPQATATGGAKVYTPYVDLEDAAYAGYKAALGDALVGVYTEALPGAAVAEVERHASEQAVGLWSAVALNALLADEIAAGTLTALDASTTTVLPRGATFDHLRFKAGALFAANGLHARYLVEKRHFEAYAAARYAKDPSTQAVFGATQEAWLRQTLTSSTATWKLVASSISFTPMIVDAATFPPSLAGSADETLVRAGLALFQGLLPAPYLLSVDQWDGFPEKRQEMLDLMRGIPNCVVLSGDIHSFYATNHGKGGGAHGVVELTGGGISSESFKGFVRGVVDGLSPGIGSIPAVAKVISYLEALLQTTFPALTYANNDGHGFVAVTIGPTQLDATMFIAPIEQVVVDAVDREAAAAPFVPVTFTVKDGVLTKV